MPVLYYFLIANRDFVDKAFINSEIDIPAEKIDVRHGTKLQKNVFNCSKSVIFVTIFNKSNSV